jgi:hypothetical protein
VTSLTIAGRPAARKGGGLAPSSNQAYKPTLLRGRKIGLAHSLAVIHSRAAILRAIAEYDQLGQVVFLARYGFGSARTPHVIAV